MEWLGWRRWQREAWRFGESELVHRQKISCYQHRDSQDYCHPNQGIVLFPSLENRRENAGEYRDDAGERNDVPNRVREFSDVLGGPSKAHRNEEEHRDDYVERSRALLNLA